MPPLRHAGGASSSSLPAWRPRVGSLRRLVLLFLAFSALRGTVLHIFTGTSSAASSDGVRMGLQEPQPTAVEAARDDSNLQPGTRDDVMSDGAEDDQAKVDDDEDDAREVVRTTTQPARQRELLLPFLETARDVLAAAPQRRRPVFIQCLPPEEAERRGIAMVRSARPRNVSLSTANALELCWRPRGGDAPLPDDQLPPTAQLPTRLEKKDLHSLFVTRSNLRRLARDGHEGWDTEDPQLADALPADGEEAIAPLQRRSCGVVGSGGDLAGAGLGKDIDHAGDVLRVNQAPTLGYERNVGSTTAFRLINNLWTKKYAALHEKCRGEAPKLRHPECAPPPKPGSPPPKGGADAALPLERDVTLLVTRADGDDFQRLAAYLRDHRPDVTLRLLSSRAVSATRNTWVVPWKHLLNETGAPEALAAVIEGREAPSSGLVGVFLLLQLCASLTVFGFAGLNDSNRYHYFKTPRNYMNRAHSFSGERALVRALSRDGALVFVHGNDQAVKSWV